MFAITGAIGFAFSTSTIWRGWVAALGVFGNYPVGRIDGTHARETNQCRNGDKMLDHFTDQCLFLIGFVEPPFRASVRTQG